MFIVTERSFLWFVVSSVSYRPCNNFSSKNKSVFSHQSTRFSTSSIQRDISVDSIPVQNYLTKKEVSDKEINLGYFFLIRSTLSNGKNIAYFFFISHKPLRLIDFKSCEGSSFFKKFGEFVVEKFPNFTGKGKFYVWIPKNYQTRRITDILRSKSISIKSYATSSKDLPVHLRRCYDLIRSYKNYQLDSYNEVNHILSVIENGLKLEEIPNKREGKPSPVTPGINSNPLPGSIRPQTRSILWWAIPIGLGFKRFYSFLRSRSTNKWGDYVYKDFAVMSTDTVKTSVDKFWEDVVNKTDDKSKVGLMLKVSFKNGNVRSISNLDIVGKSNLEEVKDIYSARWEIREEIYETWEVDKIIMTHKVFSDAKEIKTKLSTPAIDEPEDKERLSTEENHEAKGFQSVSGLKILAQIPAHSHLKEWGKLEYNSNLKEYKIHLKNKPYVAIIANERSGRRVTIYKKQIGGLYKLITFRDEVINRKSNSIKRLFADKIIYYIDGKQVFLQEKRHVNFIKPTFARKKGEFKPKIITMDLETRTINNKMEALLLSICKGSTKEDLKTFKRWDYSSAEEMIKAGFSSLLNYKNNGASIYFHNFAKFDSTFIIKTLMNMEKVHVVPLYREGIMLSLGITYGGDSSNRNKCHVDVYDSLLILPASLDKLGKSFGKEHKAVFPLKILNDTNISLDYAGPFPGIEYYFHPNTLQVGAYKEFTDKFEKYKLKFISSKWILKDELIKYCEQDVITLHSVIKTFGGFIWDKFRVDVHKLPTLPSTAFSVFRRAFLKWFKIPIIGGGMYNNIKEAYYGGFVDIYKPSAENIECYDVNSLYPYAMQNKPMPVGAPTYFEGNPSYIPDLFGFVYAKINAPDIKTPILPLRLKTGVVIYPTGNWEGWYFTEELKNSEKYGYKFEILKGYHFQKAMIFKDYVQEFYNIKSTVSPDNPWYLIAKLFLNALYGRFGMSPFMPSSVVLTEEEFDKLIKDKNFDDSFEIIDMRKMGEKIWVSYVERKIDNDDLPNISVAVSAAITGWSRIHMTQFIVPYADKICAIDTDGVKLTCKLDDSLVSAKILGQMKHEGSFKEGVFIAPKVYGLINNEDQYIKVKGLKGIISYWTLKILLYKDKIKLNHEKWYRDYQNATITTKNDNYHLRATENKRTLIRDSCGKIIDTIPKRVVDGVIQEETSTVLFYLPAPAVNKENVGISNINSYKLEIYDNSNLDSNKLEKCDSQLCSVVEYGDLNAIDYSQIDGNKLILPLEDDGWQY